MVESGENEEESGVMVRGRMDIKQRISDRMKAVQEIDTYLDFCLQDLGDNFTLKRKRDQDRLVNRINRWSVVLGHQPVTDACRIIDSDDIHLLVEHNKQPRVFFVGSSSGMNHYYIAYDSNHCSCDFFKYKVMESNESYLCEHLIATRIAKFLRYEEVKDPNFLNEFNGIKMESPSADLKGNREQVMANLASIRVGKTKLLKMLSNFKRVEDNGEAVDKDVISKLVEAYDALNKQEEDYIRVIRDIIQQQVGEYAKEFNKSKSENSEEEGEEADITADDIIKEVDEIEKDAIVASAKHDMLISTIKERLEKKKLLDQIHQIEDPQTDTKSDLIEKLELTKLRLANEKESVDRAEDIRNRLKREAIKRGYLTTQGSNIVAAPSIEQIELGPDQRVPPLNNPDASVQPLDDEAKAEVHAKIQRHIDQIKARKQRMRECYAQAHEMMDLKKAYSDAVKRSNDLESMHKHLQDLKLENDAKTDENAEAINEIISEATETKPE